MSDNNTLLREIESIRLKIHELESKKNSGKPLTGYEEAILKDMLNVLSVKKKLSERRE